MAAAGDAPQGVFLLPDPGAAEYSSRLAPPRRLDGFGVALRDVMPAALQADGRLDEVAGIIARAEEEGVRVSAEFARDLLWWRGVPEPQSALGLFSGVPGDDLARRIAGWAEEEAAGGAHLHGMASREIPGGVRVVAMVLRSGVALDPVPRRLAVPGELSLGGRVSAEVGAVTLVVTGPDDSGPRYPAERRGDRFSVSMLLHTAGIWQVELMGDGPRGPTVLANFPVYVGVGTPTSVGLMATELESSAPRELEDMLFEMLREVRRERGFGPLERSAALDAVARGYAREMARTGVVAHVSPESGGPADRAAAAGLVFPRLRENLARAHSAAEAHAGLMGSPAHRGNMLDPLAFEAGLGVSLVRSEGGAYFMLTQLIVSRPPAIDPAEVEREIALEVNRRRGLTGAPAAARSPDLDRAARRLLASCFGGERPGDIDFGGDGLVRVVAFEVTTASLDGVLCEAPDQLLEPGTTHLGVAVTQGRDPRLGDGMICLRMLLGQKR